MNDVTRILAAIERGDAQSTDQLLPLVYDELRKLAARHLAQERPGQTLQATALVNEAYLRLVGSADDRQWDSRGHFFAAAALAMRRILVENARRKGARSMAAAVAANMVSSTACARTSRPKSSWRFHEALEEFALHDPQKAKLVELRFFGGLTLEQAAATLKISLSSAERLEVRSRVALHRPRRPPARKPRKRKSRLKGFKRPRRMKRRQTRLTTTARAVNGRDHRHSNLFSRNQGAVMKHAQPAGQKKSVTTARQGRGLRTTRWQPHMEVLEVRQTPTVFSVNTVLDTVAVNLKNGKDATGHVSLRSAIMAANAHPGSDTIKLPVGTFKLTIPGAGEDADATGDLDINGNLTIQGKSSTSTIVDGNGLDRVFEVLSGTVSFSKLTIQDGRNTEGAGLFNAGGRVTLTSVAVIDNFAVGLNGANGTNGSGNETTGAGVRIGFAGFGGQAGGAAAGGGIFNASGSLTLVGSTIAANQAIGGNGGRGGNGADAIGADGVSSTTMATRDGEVAVGGIGGAGGQGGTGQGGGIFNAPGASLTITGSVVTNNLAVGGNGGTGGTGGTGEGGRGALPLGSVAGTVGFGGNGFGGTGGASGQAGVGEGGGLFNASLTSLSTKANSFVDDAALGGAGGQGGTGGEGVGGRGGDDLRTGGTGGGGGSGSGGTAGAVLSGGHAFGGAVDNASGGTLTNSVAVTFSSNVAAGGQGGNGGAGGEGQGGMGGQGTDSSFGGLSGSGGISGIGGDGGVGLGAGLFNSGAATATFAAKKNVSSETLAVFTNNRAQGGMGGIGGTGGVAFGGFGGNSGAPSQGGSGGFGSGSNAPRQAAVGSPKGAGSTTMAPFHSHL